MHDRKSLGALVIGIPAKSDTADEAEEGKKEGPPELERSPEEMKALHDEAIDDVFDAAKAGDREAFRDAFSAAVRVCMMAEEEGLYGDGEPESEG